MNIIFRMVFFGDAEQRAVAVKLGANGLVGLGGYGVISALLRLARALIRRRE